MSLLFRSIASVPLVSTGLWMKSDGYVPPTPLCHIACLLFQHKVHELHKLLNRRQRKKVPSIRFNFKDYFSALGRSTMCGR